MKVKLHILLMCLALVTAVCLPLTAQVIIECENILNPDGTAISPWYIPLSGSVESAVKRFPVSEPYSYGGMGLKIVDDLTGGDESKIFIRSNSPFPFENGEATAVVRVKTTSDAAFNALGSPPTADNPWCRTVTLAFQTKPGTSNKRGIGLCIRPDRAAIMNNLGRTMYGKEVIGDNTRYVTWTIVGRDYGNSFELYRNGVLVSSGTNGSNLETPAVPGTDGLVLCSAPNVVTGSWIFDRVAYKSGADPYWNPWPAPTGEITGVVSDATNPNVKIANATVRLMNTGQTVTTDASGIYTFTGLEPEAYSIQVSAAGYYTKSYKDIPVGDGDHTLQNVTLTPFPTPVMEVTDTFTRPGPELGTTEDTLQFPWDATGEEGMAAIINESLMLGSMRTHGVSIGGGFQPDNVDIKVTIGPIYAVAAEIEWAGVGYRQTVPCTYDTWNGQSAEQAGYLVWCTQNGSEINLWRNKLIAQARTSVDWSAPHELRIIAIGGHHEVHLDGEKIIDVYNDEKLTGGYVTLLRDSAGVVFDNLTVGVLPTGELGTISGTVYEAGNPSKKVAGAFIYSSDGRTITTDAQGNYSVPLAGLDYTVMTAKAAGYKDKTIGFDPLPGANTQDIAMEPDTSYYATIGEAKKAAIDSPVTLFAKVITAQWNGTTLTIEEPDRSAGIKVVLPTTDVSLWSKLDKHIYVRGTLKSDAATGELYIQATDWYELPIANNRLKPVVVNGQDGIGAGLDTTGLFVREVGKVTEVDTALRVITINDGGADVKIPVDTGVSITNWPEVGDWISVDGISTLYGATPSTAVRAIKPWSGDSNSLANGGIEGDWVQWEGFLTPVSWGIHVNGGAGVTIVQDTTNPHSGQACALVSNTSGVSGGVYGEFYQIAGCLPDTEYEISCWVRGTNVSEHNAWLDWWNMENNMPTWYLNIPAGTYGWTRISKIFRTRPTQTHFYLALIIQNTCDELAIDDVSIRPARGIFTWIPQP